MDISVADNPERQRFEIRLDGELAGFAEYRPRDGALAFTHTEVDPRHRGRGLGGALIGAALEQVRADGGRVLPLCSFVVDYVGQHPEYRDLVAYGRTDAGGA
ncbi:MAG TPA: GNAT family N-acetyltransferase [Pilimelia sp.]|nr:GNAT family N-acetyltransferase [Pilimelia sp.]